MFQTRSWFYSANIWRDGKMFATSEDIVELPVSISAKGALLKIKGDLTQKMLCGTVVQFLAFNEVPND